MSDPIYIDVQALAHENNALKRRISELERDGERLDWLEECFEWQIRPTPITWLFKEPESTMRQAIDAAMQSAKGQNEQAK